MRFKLYLSNCNSTTDRFEIRSVARSKVAVMILGLNSIFSKCGMCRVFAQRVTYSPSLPLASLCVLPLFLSSSAFSPLRSTSPYPSPSPLFHFPSLLLGEGVIQVSDSSLLDQKVMPVLNLLLSATNQGAIPMARTST